MAGTVQGQGSMVRYWVDSDGDVRIGVIGRDDRTGRWCGFEVAMTWHEFSALHECAYNDREEIAQSRIPY